MDCNRRDFLKMFGVAAAMAAVPAPLLKMGDTINAAMPVDDLLAAVSEFMVHQQEYDYHYGMPAHIWTLLVFVRDGEGHIKREVLFMCHMGENAPQEVRRLAAQSAAHQIRKHLGASKYRVGRMDGARALIEM